MNETIVSNLINKGKEEIYKEKGLIIETVASVIPCAGPIVAKKISEEREKRINELVSLILDREQSIPVHLQDDLEFIINLGRTVEATNRLSTNEKLKYFANLVRNGYFNDNHIYTSDFDEYFQILQTLSYREIEILFLCSQYLPSKRYSAIDRSGELYSALRDNLGLEKSRAVFHLNRLESTGFIERKESEQLHKLYQPSVFFLKTEFLDDFATAISDFTNTRKEGLDFDKKT